MPASGRGTLVDAGRSLFSDNKVHVHDNSQNRFVTLIYNEVPVHTLFVLYNEYFFVAFLFFYEHDCFLLGPLSLPTSSNS